MSGPEIKAPGLCWYARANQRSVATWVASRKARQIGYRPKTVNLAYCDSDVEIVAECRRLQADMLSWLANEGERKVEFDGSLKSLIELYQTDDLSSFNDESKVKWSTRYHYTRRLAVLVEEVGDRRLHTLGARDFDRWYRSFRSPAKEGEPERITRAHDLMNMLRMVMSFGVVLEISECARLSTILSKMRFEKGTPAKPLLTAQMVDDFRRGAHAAGRPSLALATAIQFETALRQKDVIGEWAPASTAVSGPLARRGKRWVNGLIWGEHINPETLVLTKPTSKSRGKKMAVVDLTRCPMVMEELAQVPAERRVGPVVTSETTGQTYTAERFNANWRTIASMVGIPDEVCNMHARGGAITEALLAGANPLGVRDFATHAELDQTSDYARRTLDATNAVRDAVNARRGK